MLNRLLLVLALALPIAPVHAHGDHSVLISTLFNSLAGPALLLVVLALFLWTTKRGR